VTSYRMPMHPQASDEMTAPACTPELGPFSFDARSGEIGHPETHNATKLK